jgi:hypothetical protein
MPISPLAFEIAGMSTLAVCGRSHFSWGGRTTRPLAPNMWNDTLTTNCWEVDTGMPRIKANRYVIIVDGPLEPPFFVKMDELGIPRLALAISEKPPKSYSYSEGETPILPRASQRRVFRGRNSGGRGHVHRSHSDEDLVGGENCDPGSCPEVRRVWQAQAWRGRLPELGGGDV